MPTFDIQQLYYILPELILTFGTIKILIVDLFLPKKYDLVSYYGTQALLLITLIFSISLYGSSEFILSGAFVVDNFSVIVKSFVIAFMVLILAYTKEYLLLKGRYVREHMTLLLFSTLGMMIMISGSSMLTLYLGLEILSLAMYSLIATHRIGGSSVEAGLKYFVLGAISSGILLYGISLVYGATGTLMISDIAVLPFEQNQALLSFAVVFIIIGVSFKLGAVPFHNWVPDVYHGASLSTTMFLTSVPKIAALALLYRMLIEGLMSGYAYWYEFLIIIGILSITLGTLVALVQKNIKRMLAYSTIANVGFIVISFALGTNEGYSSGVFFTITYAITAIATFGVLLLLSSKDYDIANISELAGLNKYDALSAFFLLIVLFSFAGIPPFIGFWGKLAVINEVVAGGYYYLAVFMVVFSVIAAYFYLNVVKALYFDPAAENRLCSKDALSIKLLLIVNIIIIVAVSILPSTLLDIVSKIFV